MIKVVLLAMNLVPPTSLAQDQVLDANIREFELSQRVEALERVLDAYDHVIEIHRRAEDDVGAIRGGMDRVDSDDR